MPWPTDELYRRFSNPENEALMRYLEQTSPSAHSDLGSLLIEAIRPLPGAAFFGPNLTACSYVVAHTQGGIAFAVAIGMTTLALRLPPLHPATKALDEVPPGWRAFNPFDAGLTRAQSRSQLDDLLRSAFVQAGPSA